jgi:hypothetical protein
MKINVNLATRPFIELRPIFLRLRIFMAVLAVVAICALVASHILQQRLDWRCCRLFYRCGRGRSLVAGSRIRS